MLDAMGEASPSEKAELLEACKGDPQLAAEHRRLVAEMQLLDTAIGKPASGPVPELPAEIRERLEQGRHEFVERLKFAADEKIIPLPSDPKTLQEARSRGATVRAVLSAPKVNWPWRLALAAALLVFAGLAAFQLFRHNTPRPAALALSPTGETGLTRPTLAWENKPGQLYDVWILPPEGSAETVDPLFVKNQTVSPVRFEELNAKTNIKELEPGKDFRLLVCLNVDGKANRLAGVATPFRVASTATAAAPAPKTAEAALSVMRRLVEAGKQGDALGIFSTLPKDIQVDSEVSAYEAALREQLRKPGSNP